MCGVPCVSALILAFFASVKKNIEDRRFCMGCMPLIHHTVCCIVICGRLKNDFASHFFILLC